MATPEKLPPADEVARLSASGLRYREIAEMFGVTKGAVQARMYRAGRKSALPRLTVEERFWAKVDRTSSPKGCWLWTASDDGHGYGQFLPRYGKNVKAYRFAWELLRGPVPDGLTLDHLCRVKLCVNPAHLEVVSHRVNILRSDGMSAVHARQTHCIHGHEFTPENTYMVPGTGSRMCRPCMRRRKNEPEARAKTNARRRRKYAERSP